LTLWEAVSGLTEKHLRFDVAAFIAQLTKIESATPDWSESTRPSIIIRAKALLWLSLTEILRNGVENTSFEKLSVLNSRVQRDLRPFVDGVVSKKMEAAKRDLLLWMMTYEIMQSGTFQKAHQLKMRRLFDDQTVDKLITFVGGLAKSDLDHVIFENVRSSRAELEKLIPQTLRRSLVQSSQRWTANSLVDDDLLSALGPRTCFSASEGTELAHLRYLCYLLQTIRQGHTIECQSAGRASNLGFIRRACIATGHRTAVKCCSWA
jgi:hypothetical protein